jgi:sugar lactone lactonase YvrE
MQHRTWRVAAWLVLLAAAGALLPACRTAVPPAEPPPQPPAQQPIGKLEPCALLYGYMPTGIAVSPDGRLFACFPRWEDGMIYTVGEVMADGSVVPYPNLAVNQPDPDAPQSSLYSVQSVVMDARGRLWALDTGRIRQRQAPAGAPKLVAFDLSTSQIVQTVVMPEAQVPADSYLNDVRFDLSQGDAGCAYITDSGRGALLVVDLSSGKVMRRLEGHPSTQPQAVLPVVEGRPLYLQPSPDAARTPPAVGADGIALSADGATLYYCPLSSRRLYSIPTAKLRDATLGEAELAREVKDLGPKPLVDGMVMDAQARLYLSAFEQNAIMRRLPDGTIETVATDARLLWPDSFSIGPDGWLYVSANQIERQPQFHAGRDARQRPFVIFRTQIGAGPAGR